MFAGWKSWLSLEELHREDDVFPVSSWAVVVIASCLWVWKNFLWHFLFFLFFERFWFFPVAATCLCVETESQLAYKNVGVILVYNRIQLSNYLEDFSKSLMFILTDTERWPLNLGQSPSLSRLWVAHFILPVLTFAMSSFSGLIYHIYMIYIIINHISFKAGLVPKAVDPFGSLEGTFFRTCANPRYHFLLLSMA